MKVQQRTIYHCDFCGVYRLRKAAIEKHELFCSANPANHRPCYTCIHLKVDKRVLMEQEDGYSLPTGLTQKTFTCSVFKKMMYGHKPELLDLPKKYREDYRDITAMPKECDEFEDHYPDPLDECREDEHQSALKAFYEA